MDPLGAYRGAKGYIAMPIAAVVSAIVAMGLAVLSVYTAGFLLGKFDGPDGPGAGVLVILVALNIAISVFIAGFTLLVNLHRPTSWRMPTFAFVLSIGLVRLMGPFDIRFAPFMLGTGAIVWAICCWLLHRRSVATNNVIQA